MSDLVSARSIIFRIGEGSIDWTRFETLTLSSSLSNPGVQGEVFCILPKRSLLTSGGCSFEMFADLIIEEFGIEGLPKLIRHFFNCDAVSLSPQFLQ